MYVCMYNCSFIHPCHILIIHVTYLPMFWESSRPRDPMKECTTIQDILYFTFWFSCIWRKLSRDSICQCWLLQQTTYLNLAFVSSRDWLAIIRCWKNNCESTWIFSPSTLMDDLALNVMACLLFLNGFSAAAFPVMESMMLCLTSLAFSTLTWISHDVYQMCMSCERISSC